MNRRLVKDRHREELNRSIGKNLLRKSILDCRFGGPIGNLAMTKLMLN